MRATRQVLCGAVLLTVGLAALLLPAAVYQTIGGAAGDLFNPASFGRCLYHAVMDVNNGRAEVSVVACEGGVDAIRAAFRTEEQAGTGRFIPGDGLGVGHAVRNGRTVSLVTLSPRTDSGPLLVSVGQSVSERNASRARELHHRLEAVPVPREARVLGYQRNTDTRTSLECLTVPMAGEEVRGYYKAAMARDGWSRVFQSAPAGGLQIYVKGSDVCCVGIGGGDSYGESNITLLHKQGAVE